MLIPPPLTGSEGDVAITALCRLDVSESGSTSSPKTARRFR